MKNIILTEDEDGIKLRTILTYYITDDYHRLNDRPLITRIQEELEGLQQSLELELYEPTDDFPLSHEFLIQQMTFLLNLINGESHHTLTDHQSYLLEEWIDSIYDGEEDEGIPSGYLEIGLKLTNHSDNSHPEFLPDEDGMREYLRLIKIIYDQIQ